MLAVAIIIGYEVVPYLIIIGGVSTRDGRLVLRHPIVIFEIHPPIIDKTQSVAVLRTELQLVFPDVHFRVEIAQQLSDVVPVIDVLQWEEWVLDATITQLLGIGIFARRSVGVSFVKHRENWYREIRTEPCRILSIVLAGCTHVEIPAYIQPILYLAVYFYPEVQPPVVVALQFQQSFLVEVAGADGIAGAFAATTKGQVVVLDRRRTHDFAVPVGIDRR